MLIRCVPTQMQAWGKDDWDKVLDASGNPVKPWGDFLDEYWFWWSLL